MQSNKKTDYVNVFWGSEIFDRQSHGTLSKKWYFFKPQTGNLAPSCFLPNTPFNVVPYSGGYPTGYGVYNSCTASVPSQFIDRKIIKGFTHFSHSGTGFINNFYNYFMLCPSDSTENLLNEKGGTGWYEADAETFNAKVALDGVAANYEFNLKSKNTVRILPYYGGLSLKNIPSQKFPYTFEKRENNLIFCMNIDEITLYFAVGSRQPFSVEMENDSYVLTFPSQNITLCVSYSFASGEEAEGRLQKALYSYTAARAKAIEIWEKELSVVTFEGDNDKKTLFYTALYTALKKPCLDFFPFPIFDIATMWDMYKTAFPLYFLFYPEKGAQMANGLSKLFANGHFYNGKLMGLTLGYSMQAVSLVSIVIATAYKYGVKADFNTLLPLAKRDVEYQANICKMFFPHVTHNLDFLDAYYALLACGVEFGSDVSDAVKYRTNRLYGKNELLKSGMRRKFYEGTNKNYSFRVSSGTTARLANCNKKILKTELDKFFGFGGKDVRLFNKPTSPITVKFYGNRYRRFEGLNNEPDMEAMYMYHKLGEYSVCEDILNEVLIHQFNASAGGVSGNDDSGGLSSWLVFNMLGLFPVTGTDEILIGCPQTDEASIMLDTPLSIKVIGRDPTKHIKRITLNGILLVDRKTDVQTLRKGGELVVEY